ncbi:MAG: hypothetical protein IJX87_06875 [Clostridia bacterium]|nr:hypothetical protein [Clostridia bacterium]
MANMKKKLKKIGRYVWEMIKGSFPAGLMYCMAGAILLMLTMKGETITWSSSKLTWTLVCILGAGAYNALIMWANGGQHYEMLVSGNIKRTSSEMYGTEYKISTHKEAKEYRAWKGFVFGAFVAVLPLVVGIIFGCNQTLIDKGEMNGGALSIFVLVSFFLSGWSILPFYYLNVSGTIQISYFISCLFALIPIAVSGAFYIAGAYARRNKALRAQELADKAAAAEAQKVKKINYGGLPGTKPKKRK